MVVRFDESLAGLCRVVAMELGEQVLEQGLVVRDVSGRLAFFASVELDSRVVERLSKSLQESLGAYARADRVISGVGDFGVDRILAERPINHLVIDSYRLRFLDRRLVGADWLRRPTEVVAPPPRVVFGSLKGGVGRSTALSVAAAHVAAGGWRVLAIDLDMEAPGLGTMLLEQSGLPKYGLVDALVENGLGGLDREFINDLIAPSPLADRRGRIDVLPAFGAVSMQYPENILAKISRAYVEDLSDGGESLSILDQIRSIVDIVATNEQYDVVLIDARAGLHETTAAAILGLGAEVLLFGLDEPQTYQGYLALFAHLARYSNLGNSTDKWIDRITMVQGRAPSEEDKRINFGQACQALFDQSGLGGQRSVSRVVAMLPAEPFSDVPWDDQALDDDSDDDAPVVRPDVLAILDDERFRSFNPHSKRDLLDDIIYKTTFSNIIDYMDDMMEFYYGPKR